MVPRVRMNKAGFLEKLNRNGIQPVQAKVIGKASLCACHQEFFVLKPSSNSVLTSNISFYIFPLMLGLTLSSALFAQAVPGSGPAKPPAPGSTPAPQAAPAPTGPTAPATQPAVKPAAPGAAPAAPLARPPVARPDQVPPAATAPTAPGTPALGQAATTATEAEVAEKQAEPASDGESIWEWLIKGGVTMIPLGLITAIIIAFSLERWFFFIRQKINTKGYYDRLVAALESGGMKEAEAMMSREDLLISRILKYAFSAKSEGVDRVEKSIETQATVEIGKLENGLNLLSNMGNLAPLLGFFGTVIGMRASFLQFVELAAPTARDLAAGVEEALITTAAGLLIAIPTYLIHNLFIFAVDRFSIELERCTAAITSRIKN